MIRVLFCLVVALLLLAALLLSYNEVPLWTSIALGSFGLLFCFITWSSARHHANLIQARKSKPTAATIFVRSTPQRRGPDRLVAEIIINQQQWRGILTGWSHEHAFANLTSEGLAWLNPKNGAPLELQIDDQILTPIPIVVKVNKDGMMEALIQKFHSFDKPGD